MKVRIQAMAFAVATTIALLGCSDSNGPTDGAMLAVNFTAATSGGNEAVPGSVLAAAAFALDLDGSNGSLTIDEIWLVADEFKLAQADGACEDTGGDGSGDDDACEKFETPPFFVPVPVDGDNAGEVSAEVAPGTYEDLKFESKAPGNDGTLLDEIRTEFPDWPSDASMLVTGSFTPSEGSPVAFRVFFNAEVKVEMEFEEPLVIVEGGDQTVTIFIDPAIWFANGDGTVDDLSALDYDTTGEVFDFEAKFADGFTKIEVGDD